MTIRSRKAIAKAFFNDREEPQLVLIKETLSDGSDVYNLMIGDYECPCNDLTDAEKRYGIILTTIIEA